MLGLFFELELAWGFGVRYPKGTAAQMAPPLPPPSTAIGAVAEALAIRLGLSELTRRGKKLCSTAYLLAKATKAAAFALSPQSPTGVIVRAELSRIYQAMYLESKYKKDPNMWFGAQAVAQAYAPKAVLWCMLVLDLSELKKELGVSEEELEEVLKEVTIRRVGAKEGIVATKKKEVGEVSTDKDVETYFYAPKKYFKYIKYSTDVLLWLPSEETFCGGSPKYEIFAVPSGPFSSQAVLTPPEEGGVLSEAYCLGEYCIWKG